MKVNEHIAELWQRLRKIGIFIAITLIVMFSISKYLIQYYIKYLDIVTYAFSPLEEIQAMMNISISLTVVASLTFIIYQAYLFIRPAFEIGNIKWKLGGASILAGISYLFGSTIVAKMLLESLTKNTLFINQWGLLSILSICFMVGLAFAIASQIMLIIPFLTWQGIIPLDKLTAIRKYIVIILLIICGIITPTGDLISLGVTFIPIYSSYEIGIISSKIIGGKQNVGSTRNSNSSTGGNSLVWST